MGTPQGGRHQVTDHTRIQEMGSWEADVGTGRREGGGGELARAEAGIGHSWGVQGIGRGQDLLKERREAGADPQVQHLLQIGERQVQHPQLGKRQV